MLTMKWITDLCRDLRAVAECNRDLKQQNSMLERRVQTLENKAPTASGCDCESIENRLTTLEEAGASDCDCESIGSRLTTLETNWTDLEQCLDEIANPPTP